MHQNELREGHMTESKAQELSHIEQNRHAKNSRSEELASSEKGSRGEVAHKHHEVQPWQQHDPQEKEDKSFFYFFVERDSTGYFPELAHKGKVNFRGIISEG